MRITYLLPLVGILALTGCNSEKKEEAPKPPSTEAPAKPPAPAENPPPAPKPN